MPYFEIAIVPFASDRSAQTSLRVVLHSKRIRLADKTCTFGRQNVSVWPAKRIRLAFKTTSLGRELTTPDERRPNVWTREHTFGTLKTV